MRPACRILSGPEPQRGHQELLQLAETERVEAQKLSHTAPRGAGADPQHRRGAGARRRRQGKRPVASVRHWRTASPCCAWHGRRRCNCSRSFSTRLKQRPQRCWRERRPMRVASERVASAMTREVDALHAQAERSRDQARRYSADLAAVALDASVEPALVDAPVRTSSVERRTRSRWWPWIVVIVSVLFGLALRTFVIAPYAVHGASMVPTLVDGERVAATSSAYRLSSPHRGDIVIVSSARETYSRTFVKRVIALPGETIEASCAGDLCSSMGGSSTSPTCVASRPEDHSTPSTSDPSASFVLGDNPQRLRRQPATSALSRWITSSAGSTPCFGRSPKSSRCEPSRVYPRESSSCSGEPAEHRPS